MSLAAKFSLSACVCNAEVMRTLQDTKLMQLQTNALDTAADIIKAVHASAELPDRKGVQQQLISMTTEDRSSAIKSQAQAVLSLLAARGTDKDVTMSNA